MRKRRLLKLCSSDRGSVVLDSIFAIVMLVILSLGVIQLALTLYARNVVYAAAHEGARSAIEVGAAPGAAQAAAVHTVETSAGGLVRHLGVTVGPGRRGETPVIQVRVTGELDPPGPLPVTLPVDVTSTLPDEVRAP